MWRYNYFRRNADTDEFEYIDVEAVVEVTNITTIDGEEFFTLETNTTYGEQNCSVCPEEGVTVEHLRDSLGYLINSEGVISFSSEKEEHYLRHEMDAFSIYGKLLPDTQTVNLDLGEYESSVNEVYAKSHADGSVYPGRDYIYYDPNIGEVFRTYSGVSSEEHNWEKRLMETN